MQLTCNLKLEGYVCNCVARFTARAHRGGREGIGAGRNVVTRGGLVSGVVIQGGLVSGVGLPDWRHPGAAGLDDGRLRLHIHLGLP